MSRAGDRSDGPQAVIHKRILDVAETNPEASLEAIADEVSGASVDLVDRVLEKYGDPSGEPPDGSVEASESTREEPPGESVPDAGSGAESVADDGGGAPGDAERATTGDDDTVQDHPQLSDDQMEALRLTARRPDATQRELAEELGVTAATVSRWLNAIPGFDWSDREAFAERILDGGDPAGTESTADDGGGTDPAANADDPGGAEPADGDAEEASDADRDEMTRTAEDGQRGDGGGDDVDASKAIADLRQRLDALEDRIGGDTDDAAADRIDTDLLHRAVRALMAADHISRDEEVRLLDRLLD